MMVRIGVVMAAQAVLEKGQAREREPGEDAGGDAERVAGHAWASALRASASVSATRKRLGR